MPALGAKFPVVCRPGHCEGVVTTARVGLLVKGNGTVETGLADVAKGADRVGYSCDMELGYLVLLL